MYTQKYLKFPVFFSAALLLASCGIPLKKTSALPQPPPKIEPVMAPEPEALEREDSPAEATEFYLLKRTGGEPLPAEFLMEAQRHARGMPLYSLANRRFVDRRNSREAASIGLGT